MVLLGPSCAGSKKQAAAPTDEMSSRVKGARKRIKKHVADKGRRKAALETLEAAQRDIASIREMTHDWRYDIAKLPGADRRDRAKLEAITERYNRAMLDKLEAAARKIHGLRQHITAAEWPQVFPVPAASGEGA